MLEYEMVTVADIFQVTTPTGIRWRTGRESRKATYYFSSRHRRMLLRL